MGLEIGKRIRIEMVKREMSVGELAKKMGISYTALGYYLSGKKRFSVKSARKVIHIFPEANFKYEDFFE